MPVGRTKHGFLGRKRLTETGKAKLKAMPKLGAFLASDFPTPPSVVDYRGGIKQWGMLGNQIAGNCVWVMILHTIMARAAFVTGKYPQFTDADGLNLYTAVTGYNQRTGANDNGTDIQTALEYWRTSGVYGNKIAGWVPVDHTNPSEVAIALYLFGPLISGINLPSSAEGQFERGQPWDLAWFAYTVGGHGVPVSAIRPGFKTIETWAQDEDETDRFFERQTEELYAVVDSDFLDAQGKSPTGLDLEGLLAASAKFGS